MPGGVMNDISGEAELQIPRFDRSNLFLRRIANPSGRLAGCEMAGVG